MTAYVSADVAAAAEAAHRALDAVDDGWHLACLQPDEDGPTSCFKGHAARQMLVVDVMPAVLDALVGAGWTPPQPQPGMAAYPAPATTFVFTEAQP